MALVREVDHREAATDSIRHFEPRRGCGSRNGIQSQFGVPLRTRGRCCCNNSSRGLLRGSRMSPFMRNEVWLARNAPGEVSLMPEMPSPSFINLPHALTIVGRLVYYLSGRTEPRDSRPRTGLQSQDAKLQRIGSSLRLPWQQGGGARVRELHLTAFSAGGPCPQRDGGKVQGQSQILAGLRP